MIFRHVNAVISEERQQGVLHQLMCRVRVVFSEVDVRQPDMGTMVELRRRESAGLELFAKGGLLRTSDVSWENPFDCGTELIFGLHFAA